ncbi:MAG: efflux RND transporter permease subunit [Nitrospira sp.]|nr:efflux RND transporter permease subunit [Nitrospira sp.]
MIANIVKHSLSQRMLVCMLGLLLLFGGLYAFHMLDVVAYPDPSPPMVEVISQNPGWSPEEVERLITIPIEIAMQGMPGLSDVRSLSIFGLSDIKIYFKFGTDYTLDRQEVLNRLQMTTLPPGVQPSISPWSAIAEIYRYEVVGEGQSLTNLKTIQDWMLRREFKRIPGVIDVTAFGGTTKEYHVDIDPGLLIQYGVSLPQVLDALSTSNANVGGSYLTLGSQSYNIRGVGLITSLDDIGNIVVTEKDGTPIFIKSLGEITLGHAIRLGKVGINQQPDVVEGVILLQREAKALATLELVKKKIEELNAWKLPQGVSLKTFYDRTTLIHTTIETVLDILISGVVLVFLILFLFLGNFRAALIVALTVPLTLLFTFSMMVMLGQSANLISLGSIDFGIIVDATLIMVESIFYQLAQTRQPGVGTDPLILRAAQRVGRPIFFSTAIIVVAFFPLFTMTGVPGKIFAPMSITYGFALIGSLLMAVTLAPVLCSLLLSRPISHNETKVVRHIRRRYLITLDWALLHPGLIIGACVVLFGLTIFILPFLGGEFMPALEEGNLWVRATMPVDISFDEAASLTNDFRKVFLKFPEVTTAASQLGRPDDGTDPTSFFNAEFFVNLKPSREWRPGLTKNHLIAQIDKELSQTPGVTFNFSQLIQDNVQEATSGVKGENSIKLFGADLQTLETIAGEIEQVMSSVPGVKDLGIFRILGQPNLLIQVDRAACARYGVRVSDVNSMVQAAIGGQAVTQVIEGEKRFDLVVRFLPQYREDAESISEIQVRTPDGKLIPLKQLAAIIKDSGAFIIYRENNDRYIPIKFSVRGRDLAGTVEEAQDRLAPHITLPERYRLEWAGQYDQLKSEETRLKFIVPLSLLLILFLLYSTFNSFQHAFLVLATVPFALMGGVLALVLTGTPFSISASVGIISTLGVAILGGVLLISSFIEFQQEGVPLKEAIRKGAEQQMRPILMATLGAAVGLLPAAVATGIGSQAQQPLARVVVGGMLTAAIMILIALPVFYQLLHTSRPPKPPTAFPKSN